MRPRVSSTARPSLVADLLLGPGGVPARAAERVACSGTAATTTCRIDDPNVTRRVTSCPQINPAAPSTLYAGTIRHGRRADVRLP